MDLRKHYSREEVRKEVRRFTRDRWVALAGPKRWIRYIRGRPLSSDDLELPDILIKTDTRSIYATIHKYRRLRNREDAFNDSLIESVTPFLDVDNELEDWRSTVEAIKVILEVLEDLGVRKSVYILWSGRGAHVRVHERALSKGDVGSAWALAELVRLRSQAKIEEIRERGAKELKVENQVKPRALFTVPLSLHRRLDRVAVCISPVEINEFDPSWVEPGNFIHYDSWDSYVEGEADKAAEFAVELLGGYRPRKSRRKEPPVDEMIKRWL